MKRKYVVLFLFSIMLLTGCANIASMRASVQLKSAKKYLLSEDYEKAIVRLNKAIKIEPKNVESYILLADTYQKVGDIDKADKILSMAKEIKNMSVEDIDKIKEKEAELGAFVHISEPSGEYSKPITIYLTNKNNYEIHYTVENDSKDILMPDTKYITPISIKKEGTYLLKTYATDATGKKYDEVSVKYKITNKKSEGNKSTIKVGTREDIERIKSNPDGSYELTNDIELGDWEPIGTEEQPFKGKLYGNGHTIKFKIDKKTNESYNAGLFGVIDGGTVSDLIIDTDIDLQVGGNGTLMANSAGICGKLLNGTIEKCLIKGEILTLGTGDAYARSGGITASAENASVISNCVVEAYIKASSNDYNTMAAGISPWLDSSTIDRCIVRGPIYGSNDIGYTYVSGISASGADGEVNSSVVETTDIVGYGNGLFLDIISNFAVCKGNIALQKGNKNGYVTYNELRNRDTYIKMGWDFINDWKMDSNSEVTLMY